MGRRWSDRNVWGRVVGEQAVLRRFRCSSAAILQAAARPDARMVEREMVYLETPVLEQLIVLERLIVSGRAIFYQQELQ